MLGEMKYQIIKTYKQLDQWLIANNNSIDRIIACDTETTSLDYLTQDLCGISFYNGESACYVDIIDNPNRKWLLKRIKQEFSFQIVTGIFQNAVYDLKVLTKFNLLPNKFPPIKIWDTMIAAQLLDENNSVNLDDLGERYLGTGKTEKWEEAISEGFHSKRFYDYALRDPVVTYKLYEVFKPILTEQGLDKVFYDIELPFVYVLRDLEINGILVDQKRLSQLHTEVTCILNKLVIELYDAGDIEYHRQYLLDESEEIIADVDLNSPQQISKFIINKLGIKLTEKTKTGYSVKGSVLEGIRNKHPFIDLLLKYRDAETLNNKFISKLPNYIQSDGRIRTNFRNTLVTGRLCIDPETLIEMPRDLSKYPKGIPLKNIKVGDWVYSFDANRELCLRKVKWVGPTQIKPTIIIYTDKGLPLTVSPDHLIRKYRGEWVYAKDLKIGNRLLCIPPRSITGGYSHFFPHSRRRGNGQQGGGIQHEHRFIYKELNKNINLTSKSIIHHKDGNKLNNSPHNLQWVLVWGDHKRLHSYNVNSLKQAIETGIGKRGKQLTKRGLENLKYLLHKKLHQNHIITKIEYGPPKQLWDIEVEDTHCVIGNDIALHNSSSNPPMQQLPRDNTGPLPIRECFIAPKGKVLVVVDYSGQELRVLAEESGDPTMIDAFYKNQDLHLTTANKFFNLNILDEVLISTHPEHEAVKKKFKSERDKAKVINFGISYGKSAYGFAKDWNISQDEAQIFIDNYFVALPSVKVWIDNVKLELKQNSYVTLFSGRRRRFPNYYKADKWGKERMERQATNVKIQGSSADLLKYASAKLLKLFNEHKQWGAKFVLSVHDEMVIEMNDEYIKDAILLIKNVLEKSIPWDNIIPYIIDINSGKTYSEAKK